MWNSWWKRKGEWFRSHFINPKRIDRNKLGPVLGQLKILVFLTKFYIIFIYLFSLNFTLFIQRIWVAATMHATTFHSVHEYSLANHNSLPRPPYSLWHSPSIIYAKRVALGAWRSSLMTTINQPWIQKLLSLLSAWGRRSCGVNSYIYICTYIEYGVN